MLPVKLESIALKAWSAPRSTTGAGSGVEVPLTFPPRGRKPLWAARGFVREPRHFSPSTWGIQIFIAGKRNFGSCSDQCWAMCAVGNELEPVPEPLVLAWPVLGKGRVTRAAEAVSTPASLPAGPFLKSLWWFPKIE